MEVLFVLIAVCPAWYMVFIDQKKEPFFSIWGGIARFAEWFYGITFFNLVLLYLRGWKDFAFERISVQFLMKYMISSVVCTVILACGKTLIKKYGKESLKKKEKIDNGC